MLNNLLVQFKTLVILFAIRSYQNGQTGTNVNPGSVPILSTLLVVKKSAKLSALCAAPNFKNSYLDTSLPILIKSLGCKYKNYKQAIE